MEYIEHLPSVLLRSVVRCYWHLRVQGTPGVLERIVPDGCAEIILNRADRFRRVADDGRSHRQAEVLLVGQLRRAVSITPEGCVDLLGIRFEPGGLHALLGVPMHELTDQDVAVDQVHRRLSGALQAAAQLGTPLERGSAVDRILLEEQSRQRNRRTPAFLAPATRLLDGGTRTVDSVADELGVGRRRLERAFRQQVGLSPRHFLRVRRIQSVLRALEGTSAPTSWARLAYAAGYFDQSHLIRDFRLIAGTTPKQYVAEQNAMNDLFALGVSHPSNP